MLLTLLNIPAADAQRIAVAPGTICCIWHDGGSAGQLLTLQSELVP